MWSASTSSQIQSSHLSIKSPVRDKRGPGDPLTASPCLLPTVSPRQPWHPGSGCGGSLLREAPLLMKGKTDRRGRSSHKLHHLLFHLRVAVTSLNPVSLHPTHPHPTAHPSHPAPRPLLPQLGWAAIQNWIAYSGAQRQTEELMETPAHISFGKLIPTSKLPQHLA